MNVATGEADKNIGYLGAPHEVRQSKRVKSFQPTPGETRKQYWAINIMRSAVVLFTVIVVLLLLDILDVVFGIAGAIFGMINVLMLPALAHLNLVADSQKERCADYFLIAFAIIMMIFLPATIIATTVNAE